MDQTIPPPEIFLIPQPNLVKDNKKDRLIFNIAKQPSMDSIPINSMMSTKHDTELQCIVGSILVKVLTHMRIICLTFPSTGIVMHAYDVKSCFGKVKNHHNDNSVFSVIIGQYLLLQCGFTFRSDFSIANWEHTSKSVVLH